MEHPTPHESAHTHSGYVHQVMMQNAVLMEILRWLIIFGLILWGGAVTNNRVRSVENQVKGIARRLDAAEKILITKKAKEP